MNHQSSQKHIIIAPQIYICLEPQGPAGTQCEAQPKKTKIPMVWMQDDANFRLDIDLPTASVLDVVIASPVISLHVNGETIWMNDSARAVQMVGAHVEDTLNGLRLTCTAGGSIHILACLATETNSPQNGFSVSPGETIVR